MNGNAAIGYSTSTAGPTNGLAVSGNVGIGTTAPTAAFDVAGNMNITGSIGPTQSWQSPTLQNGWVWLGTGFANPGYLKDKFGIIHFRGTVYNGSCGSAIFTLPAGYRIGQYGMFAVLTNNTIGRVGISADGSVTPQLACSNAWVSLDGISFLAEN